MTDFQRVVQEPFVRNDGAIVDPITGNEGVLKQVFLELSVDGDVLGAYLSDGGTGRKFGKVHGLEQRLRHLEARWLNGHSSVVSVDAQECSTLPTSWLRSFGTELFNTLLPGEIQAYFQDALPYRLKLVVDTKLIGVPWECAFDGHYHWQQFHPVSRRLLGQDGGTESCQVPQNASSLKVLLDCPGSANAAWLGYAGDLEQVLNSIASISAERGDQQGLGFKEWDIVHVIDTPSRFSQRTRDDPDLVRRLSASRLVIFDWQILSSERDTWQKECEVVANALAKQTGLICIKRPFGAPHDAAVARNLYEFIVMGASLADLLGSGRFPGSSVLSLYSDSRIWLPPHATELRTHRISRQVTALSYDMFRSTDLQKSIGAESYSARLREFHFRLSAVISRWGGTYEDRKSDDGTMCYFGAHYARENTIQFALNAAQEMLQEAKRMELLVRIGLATGELKVDDDIQTGEFIPLAKRIQVMAPTGAILTSDFTAKLASSYFTLDEFSLDGGLKSFPEEIKVYRLGAKKALHRSGFDVAPETIRLHGRHTEMALLDSAWAIVGLGRQKWLHVSGDAGIGKSRLVASFLNRIQQQSNARTFTCRCYAETAGRAFAPIVDMLERWFQVRPNDDLTTRQSKLAQSVTEFGVSPEDHLAVSYLMGLPAPQNQSSELPDTQEPRRKFLMRTMALWLLNQARSQRVCFVVEDLQWADPSTLEYLDRLKSDAGSCGLLVILTERTEQDPKPTNPLIDDAICLGRLPPADVREMIETLIAGTDVSIRVVNTIEAKSDGVPLFVEMSTRMVLENLHKYDSAGTNGLSVELPIPASVRDLLMQRLDNLGPALTLARLCSAVGREFSRHLLLTLCEANVVSIPADHVKDHLARLLRSGLLLSYGADEAGSVQYHFRHALVHEVAYQSIWVTDRGPLHLRIARAIERQLPDFGAAKPEVLAHHYQAGEALAEAAKWYWLSARKSKANEAHTESLAHLASAKMLLQQLPSSPQRLKSELDIELTMAGQLIATKGYGAPGVGQCYVAALSHAQALNDKKSVLRAQLGLEAYHLMRADFGQAHAYLTQAQNTAREFDDALTRAQCLFALANILHHQGHAQGMQDACSQCIDVCRASKLRGKLVQSPEVMSLMYSAICLWEMGQVDLARKRGQEGVDIAAELGQRLGLGQALGMQAMLLVLCGEMEEAERLSEQAIGVCEAGDHEMWAAHARIVYGFCVSERGDPERGRTLMDLGYAQWTSTGTVITRTFYLALRAHASAVQGRRVEALRLINEACRIVTENGERYYEPEVFRIKAELLLWESPVGGTDNEILADALFAQAKTSAKVLGLPSLTLRVATSMARRCQQQGRDAAAIDLLSTALSALTEGHDTRDQKVARELLVQLGG
jgi:class 3 adenylate cyclase/tetratricopeptide (TPR) repeat protein